MRVLINAVSANMGGALTYITNVLREIPRVADNDKFVVIIPLAIQKTLEHVVDKKVIELVPYELGEGKNFQRIYFDNWVLPRLELAYKADILFSSTGFGSLRSRCPEILLVRNAVYFCPVLQQKYKEIGKSFHAIRARRWMSLLSARAADVVLFPTHAMRRMVGEHICLNDNRSAVLHYGFDREDFFQNHAKLPTIAEQMDSWRAEGCHILLNVSHYTFHKNFEMIAEALSELVTTGLRVKCICTISDKLLVPGSVLATSYETLMRRISQLNLEDTFICAGHYSYGQLHALYQRADLFVFPSLTESFGHPLVEAMACGLPVVASDMATNREICDQAAIYFEACDTHSCASIIEAVLRNRERQERMQTLGLELACRFNWRSYTELLMKLFRDLYEKTQ